MIFPNLKPVWYKPYYKEKGWNEVRASEGGKWVAEEAGGGRGGGAEGGGSGGRWRWQRRLRCGT